MDAAWLATLASSPCAFIEMAISRISGAYMRQADVTRPSKRWLLAKGEKMSKTMNTRLRAMLLEDALLIRRALALMLDKELGI
jgi:hypothetical protein